MKRVCSFAVSRIVTYYYAASQRVAWSVGLSVALIVCHTSEPLEPSTVLWAFHTMHPSSIMSVSAVSAVSIRQQAREKRDADSCTCTVCRPSYNPYGIVICSDVPCPCGSNSGNTMGLSFDSSIPRSRSWRLLTYLDVLAALRSRCIHYIFALFLLLSSFLGFFLAWSQRSQTRCLPYFYTWCGLSVNLECRSEN